MQWQRWTSVLALGVLVGRVFAQDAVAPAGHTSDVSVVRVRVGYTGGLCGGCGYCTVLTTIEPLFIIQESKDSGDKRQFPDKRKKRAITKPDWENLLRAIDKESLKAIPQPKGCRACIDLPDSWVEVNFSDGTRIEVSYAPWSPPAPAATLLREIGKISTK